MRRPGQQQRRDHGEDDRAGARTPAEGADRDAEPEDTERAGQAGLEARAERLGVPRQTGAEPGRRHGQQEHPAADAARTARRRIAPLRGGLPGGVGRVQVRRRVRDRVLGPPQIAAGDRARRAVLDDGVPPPGGRSGHGGRLRLGRRDRGRLRGHRIERAGLGIGEAAALGPVAGAGEADREHDGETEDGVVVQHREEEAAAGEGEEHGDEGGAVDPAREQPAGLVLVLAVEGDDEPREAVEDQAGAAGDGQDAETDPEDHRVEVEVPAEPAAHAAHQLVPPAAAQRGQRVCGSGSSALPGSGGVVRLCHTSMVRGAPAPRHPRRPWTIPDFRP